MCNKDMNAKKFDSLVSNYNTYNNENEHRDVVQPQFINGSSIAASSSLRNNEIVESVENITAVG